MDRRPIEECWKDNANWTWGAIYHCREDPRAIVPRRWRWGGWTLNFSHPRVGIVGLGAFVLATGPGLLAFLLFGNQQVAVVVMVLSIVALMIWAHLESSRLY